MEGMEPRFYSSHVKFSSLLSFYIKIIPPLSWRTTSHFNIKQVRTFLAYFIDNYIFLSNFIGHVANNMH
jgi:hypothetical protein